MESYEKLLGMINRLCMPTIEKEKLINLVDDCIDECIKVMAHYYGDDSFNERSLVDG